METDVAIHQVVANQWSSMAEATYASSGSQLRYYQNVKRRNPKNPQLREGSSAISRRQRAKAQMRVSRSYEDELENVALLQPAHSEESLQSKSRDDLSLQSSGGLHGPQVTKPTLSSTPVGSSSPSAMRFRVDRSHKAEVGSEQKKTSRRKVSGKQIEVQKVNQQAHDNEMAKSETDDATLAESSAGSITVVHMTSSGESVPVQYFLKQDPFRNKSKTGSLSGGLDLEKPPSMVILEVKDGPTIVYKQSDCTLSDESRDFTCLRTKIRPDTPVALAEKVKLSSLTSQSLTSHHHNRTPSDDTAKQTAQDKHPSTVGRHKIPHDEIVVGPNKKSAQPFTDDLFISEDTSNPPSPKVKQKSALPSAPRKSRLQKKSSSSRDDMTADSAFALSSVDFQESKKVPATSKLPCPRSGIPKPTISGQKKSQVKDSSTTNAGFESPTSLAKLPLDLAPPETATVSKPVNSDGFRNVSVVMQRKAGVRHDDIVVGPRRQITAPPEEHPLITDVECPSLVENSCDSATESEMTDTAPLLKLKVDAHNRSLNPFACRSGDNLNYVETEYVTSGNEKASATPSPLSPSEDKSSPEMLTASSLSPVQAADFPNCMSERKITAEQARGRAKEKRRMKRGNREVNVSTESGYVTDMARNDALDLSYSPVKIPESSSSSSSNNDSYASFSLPQRKKINTNYPKADFENSPESEEIMNNSQVNYSRKYQAMPRLNMSSNLPVPMSYDPPSTQSKTVNDPIETSSKKEPFSFDQTLLSQKSAENQKSNMPCTVNAAFSTDNSEVPVSFSSKNKRRFIAKKAHGSLEQQEVTQVPDRKDLPERECQALSKDAPLKDIDNVNNSETSLADLSRKESEKRVPGPAVIKPRLHHSEEYLVQDEKSLSVFQSSDHIEDANLVNLGAMDLSQKKPLKDLTSKTMTPTSLTTTDTSSPVPSNASTPSASKGKCSHLPLTQDKVSPLRNKSYERLCDQPSFGIVRRSSDRVAAERVVTVCRQGSERAVLGSERALLVRRIDPSVENLKKATSLKELCQSMASLLHVDNETAAEMLSSSLSQRQDLLDGLDADAITDYLTHHGVLDPALLKGIEPGVTTSQRNSVIIRHVEEHGSTAVALFINALRQSGQLHLASSLDTEQRIQPVEGQGYFGKSRHKGEITVQINVDALKILAPREPRTDYSINASLLDSPSQPDGLDVRVEDDDDVVKARSCWCFCFSKKSKSARSASSKRSTSKKPSEGKKYVERLSNEKEIKLSDQEAVNKKDLNVKPHRTKSKEKPQKKSKSSGTTDSSLSSSKPKEKPGKKVKSKSKSKDINSGNSHAVPEEVPPQEPLFDPGSTLSSVPDVVYSAGQDQVSVQRQQSPDLNTLPQTGQDTSSTRDHKNGVSVPAVSDPSLSLSSKKPEKENWDPIIMEYDPQLELVKLRAGQEELASPTRQTSQLGIMCEQWKSDGKFFAHKSSQFCKKVVEDFHMDIVKYFEQDRGTLVLDVVAEDSSVLVFNICMKRDQVRRLQEEVTSGSLLTKIHEKFLSKVNLTQWDIRGTNFNIVLDDQQLTTVLSELS